MRRALFGGSFDPPHRGHVAVVDELLRRQVADRVVVVPAARSPLKAGVPAAAGDRLAMLRIALAGRPGVEIWTVEISRPGPSYTVETLREARRRWPADELLLVLGADAWAQLPRWREPAALLELARPVVIPRACAGPVAGDREVVVLEGFDVPVSSSDVREALARGHVPEQALPPGVGDYIRRRRLYGLAAHEREDG